MSTDYDSDELEQGPQPPHPHWPSWLLFAFVMAAMAWLTACSTRHYPPAPHYTGYVLEERNG